MPQAPVVQRHTADKVDLCQRRPSGAFQPAHKGVQMIQFVAVLEANNEARGKIVVPQGGVEI